VTSCESLRQRLVDRLSASGELDAAWREAFTSVPRHAFIPDTMWQQQAGKLVPLRRIEDEQAWVEQAYGPGAVVIQVDDGHPAGSGQTGRYITSSASQPKVVALMLAALRTEPGG
jgi:protein-L-isoaspartate O-methyltransferase